ncbi:MAG: ATP-dependent zinc metalloprotease FtsH [Eubacteriales bacterium]|nr:ATP-dependent zinc metalloprotease FtsH [Eubacteriales bacterium]
MKNRKISTIIIWLVILGVIIYLVSGGLNRNKPDELTLSEFNRKVSNGEVAAVQYTLESDYFVGIYKTSTDKSMEDLPAKADFTLEMGEDTFLRDIAAILGMEPDKVTSENINTLFEYGEVLPEGASIFSIILPYILIFGVFAVFYYFMMRQQGGGKQVMNFGKSKARVEDTNKNHITFGDVAGADEEKAELQEVVQFMRDPHKFNEIGARIPKGVLLLGPPGTGKTLLAKAVAGEAKVPFFSISGSDFVEMFVGVGASRVRDLFTTAKRATPAVVFIDEIDAVGRQRGAGLGGGHDEREQTLNQLLVEMDGFAANEGIIVLAATNRADILDPALLRPGRFDRQIHVGYPDVKGREEILKVHARNKKFEPTVDLQTIARRTPYFTGADLENLLNEAAIMTARADKKLIGMAELEEAATRVQMGPEKKSRVVTEEDKKNTAYHEAGHAILTLNLNKCDTLHEVSIIQRGGAAGYTMMLPKDDMMHMTRQRLLDNICMSLGGRVAEKLKFTDVCTGAIADLKNATDIARKMVEEYGMSDAIGPMYLGGDQEVFIAKDWGHSKNYSEAVTAKADAEIRRILDEQFERAESILSSSLDALDRTAQMLIQYERVTGEQFTRVYQGEDAAFVMGAKQTAEVGETQETKE